MREGRPTGGTGERMPFCPPPPPAPIEHSMILSCDLEPTIPPSFLHRLSTQSPRIVRPGLPPVQVCYCTVTPIQGPTPSLPSWTLGPSLGPSHRPAARPPARPSTPLSHPQGARHTRGSPLLAPPTPIFFAFSFSWHDHPRPLLASSSPGPPFKFFSWRPALRARASLRCAVPFPSPFPSLHHLCGRTSVLDGEGRGIQVRGSIPLSFFWRARGAPRGPRTRDGAF